MTETYAIVSRKRIPGQQAAFLTHTTGENLSLFRLEINRDIPVEELHGAFRLYARNGFYVFEHEQALNWIKGRVYEPGYEGIQMVLDYVGIPYYDAWEIFKKYKGRRSNDDLEAVLIDVKE